MVLTRSPGEGWLLRKLALKASRCVHMRGACGSWRVWLRVRAVLGARGSSRRAGHLARAVVDCFQ